jgi:hypothetical protein
MSEDLEVDARQHPHDDADATAVRPALVDDLLGPSASAESTGSTGSTATTGPATTPYGPPPDDDLMADEEFLTPGGQRPSRLTRLLLALLILAVGILVGVQLGKAAGGSATSAPSSAGQSRRFGPPGGSPGGGGSPAPRSTLGSSAPAVLGTVTSAKSHALVVKDADGLSHTVTFTDATTVTKAYGSGALGVGDAVTVFGSRAADGSVNATSIVVR